MTDLKSKTSSHNRIFGPKTDILDKKFHTTNLIQYAGRTHSQCKVKAHVYFKILDDRKSYENDRHCRKSKDAVIACLRGAFSLIPEGDLDQQTALASKIKKVLVRSNTFEKAGKKLIAINLQLTDVNTGKVVYSQTHNRHHGAPTLKIIQEIRKSSFQSGNAIPKEATPCFGDGDVSDGDSASTMSQFSNADVDLPVGCFGWLLGSLFKKSNK